MGIKMEIMKIQLQQFPTRDRILVYNEDHSIYYETGLETVGEPLYTVIQEENKVYMEGYLDENGLLHLENFVEEQIW